MLLWMSAPSSKRIRFAEQQPQQLEQQSQQQSQSTQSDNDDDVMDEIKEEIESKRDGIDYQSKYFNNKLLFQSIMAFLCCDEYHILFQNYFMNIQINYKYETILYIWILKKELNGLSIKQSNIIQASDINERKQVLKYLECVDIYSIFGAAFVFFVKLKI